MLCLKPTAARVALLVAPALLPVMAASLRPRLAGAVVQLGQLQWRLPHRYSHYPELASLAPFLSHVLGTRAMGRHRLCSF